MRRFLTVIITKVAANAEDELRYYKTLQPRFKEYYKEDIHEALALVNTMAECAKRNKRYDIQDKLDKVVNEYLECFMMYL